MRTPVVVDASVAMKWVVAETGSDQAGQLLTDMAAERLSLVAPEHLIGEVGNGLRKRVTQGHLSVADALAAMEALGALGVELIGGAERWLRTLRAALDWGVTAYDALYAQLAIDLDADLITADMRLFDSARRASLPVLALTARS